MKNQILICFFLLRYTYSIIKKKQIKIFINSIEIFNN